MSSFRPSPAYSWRFLIGWLAGAALGGLAGGLAGAAAGGYFLPGLALGIVAGNLLVAGVHLWRARLPLTPPLPDSNARRLRWVSALTALGAGGYLAAGWAGVPFNRFFPWDGLGLLLLCGAAELLLRGGHSFWASSCLLGGFLIPIAFNAQFYGMSSPVNALYVLGLLVSGLVLGSNGFFGALMAISTLTALFAVGEQQGQWPTVYPVGSPAQSAGLVLFWWVVYAAGAWLSWLFARTLERAVQVSRGQTLALARTITAIAPSASLEQVLRQALAAVAEQLAVPTVRLFLLDPATGVIQLRLAQLSGRAVAGAAEADPVLPLWPELQRTRRPLVVDDVANDARLGPRAALLARGVQTLLGVPLLDGEAVAGFFSAEWPARRRFDADTLELAQALAQPMALALRLAWLAEQNQQAALLQERNRLARDIHDTLAQGFTGIVVQLEAAEDVLAEDEAAARQHLARARALARDSLAEARRSVYALRPASLEHQPLPQALRAAVLALTAGTGLEVTVQTDEAWPDLAPGLEADLLRLGQEAVTNILRHAEARHVRIRLQANAASVSLEIGDDGRGFDPAAPRPSASGGLGLVGIRERVARHGGSLDVHSAPGAGATLRATLPLRVDKPHA